MITKTQEVQPRTFPTPKIIVLKEGNEFFRAESLQQITPNALSHWRNQWMQVYKSYIQDSVLASKDL